MTKMQEEIDQKIYVKEENHTAWKEKSCGCCEIFEKTKKSQSQETLTRSTRR